MSEYIDRKTLLEDVQKIGGSPWSEWETAGVFRVIRKQPVLTLDDIRPKGLWFHHENGVAYCSECKTDAVEDMTNFCPECGADMRGGTT